MALRASGPGRVRTGVRPRCSSGRPQPAEGGGVAPAARLPGVRVWSGTHDDRMSFRPGSARPRPVATLPSVILMRDHGRDALAGPIRDGTVRRVGWGIYVPSVGQLDPTADALARIVGVHRRLASEHVFSHESAALLHGLPVWRVPAVTSVYQGWRSGGHGDDDVVRRAGVEGLDRTLIAGPPVTSIERTALDCARTSPPHAGLVVVDAALRAGADPALLARMARDLGRRQGAARARAVIRYADDGAESAPESVSRFLVLAAGLPRPTTQVRVPTRLGPRWGDLGWPQWHLLLEYDGRSKYADRRDLFEEKERQDLIAEAGYRALRVVKRDIDRPDEFLARVLRAVPTDVRLEPIREFAAPVGRLLTRVAA